MFSPDSFYDYLRYKYNWPEKPAIIRNMYPHGSSNIDNLYVFNSIFSNISSNNSKNIPPLRFLGKCELLDQEPVNLSNFSYTMSRYNKDISVFPVDNSRLDDCKLNEYKKTDIHPLFLSSMGIYTPIIAHSEKNSDDIGILNNNYYTSVHYWVHGIYAKEWFRKYKYLKKHNIHIKKRFGVYAREADGTRKYRIDMLNYLSSINNHVYYTFQPEILKYYINNNIKILSCWEQSNENISSNNSATINWNDHSKFDIHIVAETLFNTNKVHLTEKILKPIIMYQPFILFGPPNSLSYLKNYGFKTFDTVWDESYDVISNATIRFNKISKLITHIANMCDSDYNKLLSKTQSIVEFNRNHFYSKVFEEKLMAELIDNFNNAFNIQEELFHMMPGGTLFYYINKKFKIYNNILEVDKSYIIENLHYLKIHHPNTYNNILKKYKNLLISL